MTLRAASGSGSGSGSDGALRSRAEIAALLNARNLTGVGAEVGVFRGAFAAELLKVWLGRQLLLVDVWRHLPDYLDSWNLDDSAAAANLEATRQAVAAYGDRARIVRLRSLEAAAELEDGSLDFVYIDANHSYWSVSQDLIAWYPKVRRGGLVSGHDYYDAIADDDLEPVREDHLDIPKELLTSYGVRSAVDEFCRRLNVVPSIIAEEEPSWFFFKS